MQEIMIKDTHKCGATTLEDIELACERNPALAVRVDNGNEITMVMELVES